MARRLSQGPSRRARRAAGIALIALAVIALHLLVTQHIALSLADFGRAAEMPQRIRVAYVRELELAAPPTAPAALVAAPARKPQAAARSARPASAPRATAAPQPAPPAPQDEAALRERALAWVAEHAASAVAAAPDATAPAQAEANAATQTGAAGAVAPAPASGAVTALAAAAAASAASGPATGVVEWPVSTRLTYALSGNYRGEVIGDAQVEWVRLGTHYQVHVDLGVGARFAPIITRRMSSEGEIAGDRLWPTRYDEDTRVMLRAPRRVTILLGPEEIALPDGRKLARTADVQDAASQFIELAARLTTRPDLMAAGKTIEMPIALRNRVGVFTFDVLGMEQTVTPFATLDTVHLKPRDIKDRGNVLSAEVWFAPQLRFLPVRIRIEQDPATFIDLVIARRPEIAAQ